MEKNRLTGFTDYLCRVACKREEREREKEGQGSAF
jgi:hypothetical protein